MTNKRWTVEMVHSNAMKLMEQNIRRELSADEVYLHDGRDVRDLEDRFQAMPIKNEYKWVINDYYACMMTQMYRAVELAYQAGVNTALSLMGEAAG